MDVTWLEIGSLRIRAPVTALTNLALAVQCAAYGRGLRRSTTERGRLWGLFFAGMALATLAGVPKHGLAHALGPVQRALVLWTSSLGAGLAVFAAQRATLTGARRRGQALDRVVEVQLWGYLVANVVLGPTMLVLIVNTAAGLGPVIVAEARIAWMQGDPSRLRVAGGLALSLLTGAVYLLRISAGPWLNHIDIAHLLMGVSYYALWTGLTERALPERLLAPRHGEVYL